MSTELAEVAESKGKKEEIKGIAKEYLEHRRRAKTQKRKAEKKKEKLEEKMEEVRGNLSLPVKLTINHKNNKKVVISWREGKTPTKIDKESMKEEDPELFENYMEMKNSFQKYSEWEAVSVQEYDR